MEESAGIQPKTKTVIGRDVAEEMLNEICKSLDLDLEIVFDDDDDDNAGRASKKKIISALMHGRLEYDKEVFKQTLIKPLTGKKEVTYLEIKEPTGVQLRGMSQIKKKNDDVGKAMAILAEVTGLGMPMINKLGSRDLMLSVGVISLFL